MSNFKTFSTGDTYQGYILMLTNDTSSYISKTGNVTKQMIDAMTFESESTASNYIVTNKLDTSIHKIRAVLVEYKF